MYDPKEVKDWVVGSSGFWFKGDVKPSQHHVDFRGTWEQVKQRSEDMAAMEKKHAEQLKRLYKKQQQERKVYWG
jgi:hypothetical protein